jgi:hypothetical protein
VVCVEMKQLKLKVGTIGFKQRTKNGGIRMLVGNKVCRVGYRYLTCEAIEVANKLLSGDSDSKFMDMMRSVAQGLEIPLHTLMVDPHIYSAGLSIKIPESQFMIDPMNIV